MIRMKKIDIQNLWAREWKNAYNFFNTKGNIKTKSRLKKIWYEDFKKMLMLVENTVRKNTLINH